MRVGTWLTLGVAILAIGVAATGCSKFGSQSQNGEQTTVVAEEPKDTGPEPSQLKGMTEEAVIALLGEPTGKIKTSSRSTWDYPGYRLVFAADGKVSDAERKTRQKASAVDASSQTVAAVAKHSKGGGPVDIKTLMPAGKVTIIDFYADWCGPCVAIAPKLEAIAKDDPDVVLRKVDIVRWQTPVTKQYGIRGIPDIRVFDANRKLVGKTHSLTEVKRLIAKAK